MTDYYTGRTRGGEKYTLTYLVDVDWDKCIGCAACVKACGQDVLMMVNTSSGYKAKLLAPSKCLGEGHCMKKCPTDALQLEFIEVKENGEDTSDRKRK
ncbi:4Fe-4S dicluster protein [Orenia metallireducens]|jgi:ferredoxin|uniref:4Fe-4S dicluster domain-containing protein n=1 Tax=Orenia metallireducens TaxID=1413210 RepID=A0A285F3K3_9FIRM|nr:4Fe-4S dicluster domain-containing protein [Orenia metallireducens]PRX34844.1 4Fe-4S dicluster protein [Orenia metallireducens]SNY05845.1 4Fe-4S dicluster domain-containing protein [Orenia metallireducens]